MSDPESYIDKCVGAIGSVNIEQLGSLSVGEQIGISGGDYSMRALGVLNILGLPVHSGLKIPKSGADVYVRMQQELQAIELLTERMPETMLAVPKFIGILTVGGEAPIAQITEDVSQGGLYKVRSQRYNQSLVNSVKAIFGDLGHIVIREETVESALSFIVDGQQKLLDFTPQPLEDTRWDSPLSHKIDRVVFEEQALTIDIDPDTTLARSLLR